MKNLKNIIAKIKRVIKLIDTWLRIPTGTIGTMF